MDDRTFTELERARLIEEEMDRQEWDEACMLDEYLYNQRLAFDIRDATNETLLG